MAMMVVDSWLVYSQVNSQATNTQESQQDFYAHLAEELIDNTYDQVGGTRRQSEITETPSQDLVHRRTGAGRAGVYAHLTPTKRRKRLTDGSLTTHLQQGRCRQCGLKTRYVCSTCNDEMEDLRRMVSVQYHGFAILKPTECASLSMCLQSIHNSLL